MPKVSRSQSPVRQLQVWPSSYSGPSFVTAAAHYPGSTIRVPRSFLSLCVLAFGFFLQCNVITTSFSRFLHITDPLVLAGVLILPLLYFRAITTSLFICFILPLTTAFLFSLFFGADRGDGETYTTAFAYFYAIFAFFFLYMLLREKLLDVFCIGIFAGFTAAAILLILDARGVPLSSVGLAFTFDKAAALAQAARGEHVDFFLRVEKAGGIWAHGNEAGPALAVAAAAAAYLSERYRRLGIYVVFAAVYLASFAFTLNRSGLLAVIAIGALLYIRNFSTTVLVRSLIFTMIGFLLLAAILPFGLFEGLEKVFAQRFLNDSNGENNAQERIETLFAGLQIAVEYPFGIGFAARAAEMSALTGLSTPHNGFLATSFASGILVGIGSAASVVYVVLRRRTVSFFFYTAIALTFGYFFEELNPNPIFMMGFGLLFAYAAMELDYLLFQSRRLNRTARFPRGIRRDGRTPPPARPEPSDWAANGAATLRKAPRL